MMLVFLIQDSFCYVKFVIMSWSRVRVCCNPTNVRQWQNKKILLLSNKSYCNNEKSMSVN